MEYETYSFLYFAKGDYDGCKRICASEGSDQSGKKGAEQDHKKAESKERRSIWMDEEMVNGLIGALNLGLIIANATDGDLVSIPKGDVQELLICLETLKNFIQKG